MVDKPRIGFIGLGLMGSAMVQRMLDLGYPMSVIANRSRTNVEAAVARGAQEVKTARELAAVSDIVMLCMDNSDSVEARMFGDDGVIAGLAAGQTVIDFGTSLPASTLKIAAEVAKTGATYMDVPLGRGPAQGREGKLNIFAAGTKEDFERLKPIFTDLGENVLHVGDLGAGHTVKLINNFYAMTIICAMAEAFAAADKAGIDRQVIYDVMSSGPLKSGMMDIVRAQAIDHEILLAFSVDNAGKDIGYYAQMAKDLGVDSPMAGSALQALKAARDEGWGDKLVPEMVDYFAQRFGKA